MLKSHHYLAEHNFSYRDLSSAVATRNTIIAQFLYTPKRILTDHGQPTHIVSVPNRKKFGTLVAIKYYSNVP